MKFSLNGFKKISKSGDITKLRHPEGHEISIKHSILSPKMRGEIEALPSEENPKEGSKPLKLAEGTPDAPVSEDMVVNIPATDVPLDVPKSEREESKKEIEKAKDMDVDAPVVATGPRIDSMKDIQDAKDAVPDQAESLANLVGTTSPEAGHKMLDAHNSAMEAHNVAMKLFAKGNSQPVPTPVTPAQSAPTTPTTPAIHDTPVMSDKMPATPRVGGDYQKQMNEANQGVEDIKQYVAKQDEANSKLSQKVLDGTIDPNRLFKNTSTAGKVSSVIGLILGGLGAGATGGKNLAVDVLQKAIDTDIDAQKSDQSNAMNLYKMNLEATKNNVEAKALTVNQLMTAAQAQITKRAADNTSQLSQLEASKAVQEIQKLKMENTENAYKAKLMNNLNSTPGSAAPGAIDLNRFNLLQRSGVMPKEDVSSATKESEKYQEAQELRHQVEDQAKHLEGKLLKGLLTPGDRESAINTYAGRLAKVGEGKFNLEESKIQMKALMPQPLDSQATIKNKEQRRAQFFSSLAETPTLQRYGLVNRTEAPTIKKMGGVSYQLGPDGNYHKVQ